MKLLCWNINGLRANLGKTPGQSFAGFLDACDADVLCFQETKLTRAEMTSELACPPGYDAFYSFAKHKKGYSGVATLVRHGRLATVGAETSACPFHEGRIVLTEHTTFVLINVYCPAHGGHLERKLAFHEFLLGYVAATKAAHVGKPLILVGDLNVIHKPLDDCDAYEPSDVTAWLDTLLATQDLTDAFRQLHPTREKAYTCWRALTGARETNYGVRLDYILCDSRLVSTNKLTSCDVWQGCPEGAPGDIKGRCNFFQWHGDAKKPSPVASSSHAKRFKATPPDAT
ncbi:hypothetical protein SDRG_09823 [Saprolegnia diclina VS20]|uniref:Endonuclease/exonuclease/phosphatase domain-containing protein n=1 Tax=Saprolegnia diclina (strain VS20) TaxID=1156394 RepID=T0RR25_SAPDV|nr:hypothetical protein SDRG_09823 [Saprolegnia diclina VS20]EQC32497.1 hypothetical protein SDRG_09823 [Saprolegnia diclina VS20]|eukprot:XP_008613998.1 hypothetical protein SDRG_09823 [Saprolegnia diclina VS20]